MKRWVNNIHTPRLDGKYLAPYKGYQIEKNWELDYKGNRIPRTDRYMVIDEDDDWIGDMYKTLAEAKAYIDSITSDQPVKSSTVSTYYKGVNRGPHFNGPIKRFKSMYYPYGYVDSYDGSPLEGMCWTVGYEEDEEGHFWRSFTDENWEKIKDMSNEEIYNKFDVAPEAEEA